MGSAGLTFAETGYTLPTGVTATVLLAAHGTTANTSRFLLKLSTLSPYWDNFSKIEIDYESVYIGGDKGTVIRNNTDAGGNGPTAGPGVNNVYPELAATGTFSWPIGAFSSGTVAIAKNNAGAMLWRITEVRLVY